MRLHDLDDLIDQSGVAEVLGLRRSVVNNWTYRYADFPEPLLRVGNRPVYSWQSVRAWCIAQFGTKRYPKLASSEGESHERSSSSELDVRAQRSAQDC